MPSIIFRLDSYSPEIISSESIVKIRSKLKFTINEMVNMWVEKSLEADILEVFLKALTSSSNQASKTICGKVLFCEVSELSLAKLMFSYQHGVISSPVKSFDDVLNLLCESSDKNIQLVNTVLSQNFSENSFVSMPNGKYMLEIVRKDKISANDKGKIESLADKLAISMVQGSFGKLSLESIDKVVDQSLSMALKIHNRVNEL